MNKINLYKLEVIENEEVREGLIRPILNKFCENRMEKDNPFHLCIREVLGGGYTDSVVLSAEYGTDPPDENSFNNCFRVLKIGKEDVLKKESDAFKKFNLRGSLYFCELEELKEQDCLTLKIEDEPAKYGVLVYKDGKINSSAVSLKGVSKYVMEHYSLADKESFDPRPAGENIEDILTKVFNDLKSKVYGTKRYDRDNPVIDAYKDRVKKKIEEAFSEERYEKLNIGELTGKTREELLKTALNYENFYIANNIHGDLNPNNVLLCLEKNCMDINTAVIIDYGEVIKKKDEHFTFVFWDLGRLTGELLLDFIDNIPKKMPEYERADFYEQTEPILKNLFSSEEAINIEGIWAFLYHILFRILYAFFSNKDNDSVSNKDNAVYATTEALRSFITTL